jgi:hypothetical protein
MRNETDKCLLCRENFADKQESHLIPKFLAEGIYYGTKPRHGLMIDKTGRTSKIQDIPKEKYLLCKICEKGIGVLETYIALRLGRINKIEYFRSFIKYKKGEFEFIEALDIDIRIYNLFIYSIVWRVSVCSYYGFQSFALNNETNENLRSILFQFLRPSQTDLFQSINKLKELPTYSHCVIAPKRKLRPPNSMMFAASHNDSIHQLHLVDYVLFFLTDSQKLVTLLKLIDNNNLDHYVRIGIGETERWKSFNENILDKIIK